MATTRSYEPNPGLLIQVFDIDFTKNPPKKTLVALINPDDTLEFSATKIDNDTGEELYKLDTVYSITGIANTSLKGKYVELLPSVSHNGEPIYNFNPTNKDTVNSGESNIANGTVDTIVNGYTNFKTLMEDYRRTHPNEIITDNILTNLINRAKGSNLSSNIKDSNMYLESLQGLLVKDIRNIMGVPRQFTPITDIRTNGSVDNKDIGVIGIKYAEKILKTIPLLLMTPGKPKFMKAYSAEEKKNALNALRGGNLQALNDGYAGKYYSLDFAYEDYYKYVNPMLRSAAMFLGIGTETVNGKMLGRFDWLTGLSDGRNVIQHHNSWSGFINKIGSWFGLDLSSMMNTFIGPYTGAIAFYADVGVNTSDSFSNTTTESQLASALNNLSDQARELHFLTGLASTQNETNKIGGTLLDVNREGSNLNPDTVMQQMHNSGGVMQSILGKAQVILAGGRLLFPKIWADSSFGRSYHCSMKLVSPSGDKLSVYLNILVPIFHLLAFVLPRQGTEQAYFSPFLVRAYFKGAFNIDMGIMGNLTITKGAEGEWTIDGLPTVAEVSFELQDLYEGLFMTSVTGPTDTALMSNIMELDYIANMCGININDQESFRTLKLWALIQGGAILDIPANIGTFIGQYVNQTWQNLFGTF